MRWPITITAMTATVMQALDMTIANVALPTMQGSLLTTQDRIAWVLTSYIVTAAIFMPPTGFLAGRFGRKRLFGFAIAGFTVTSMLCGIAGSLEEIVVYRAAQGAFGAFLVPLSQAIMLDTYPREQHGSAMAIWSSGVMIGPIVGPTLGGWLTETYDWRWIFFINLPFGVLALVGLLVFVPETGRDRARRFDWFGFALLALAVGCFQLMLDRGELKDWFDSAEIVIEASVAAMAFYMFIAHTATAPGRAFIPPHIVADRNVIAGLVLVTAFGALLLTALVLLPPFLQHLMDYPVLAVGWVLAPPRRGRDGGDADGEPGKPDSRHASHIAGRARADRLVDVGDGGVQHQCGHVHADMDRPCAGIRAGDVFRAAERVHLRNSRPAPPDRGPRACSTWRAISGVRWRSPCWWRW